MSRVNPTDFANFLMGGLRTGIGLGESVNQQAFQREQFNANEQQRGFANTLAMDSHEMQRMQILQQAEDRVSKREELENKRKATYELMRVAGDPNARYNPSDPRYAKWLEAVDRETQDRFYSAGNSRNYLDKRKAEVEARIAAGYKFSKREADNYEKDGIFIEEQHLLPTAKSERQQQDDNDKNGYLTLMVDRFGLPQETAQKWLTKSAKFVSDRYNEFKGAAEAVAKQQAEQQAAAQKQQLEQQSMQAATPALGRYRNGTATDADLIQLKNANLITASGIEPNKPMDDKGVFARKQIEDIDKELQFVDQQLMEMGVASRARVSDPVTINQDKAKDGAPGTSFWGNKKEATPEYTKTQQLLSRRDQLLQARQQVGTQLVGGQQPAAQVDGRAIIQQFTAQNGRKPTTQELADLLRRASQGTPQQPVLQR